MDNNNENPSDNDLNIKLLNNNNEQNDDEKNQDDKYKDFDYDENINIDDTLYSERKTFAPKSKLLSTTKQNKEPLFQKFDSRKTYNRIEPQGKETIFKKRITEFLLKKKQRNKIKKK